MKIFLAGGTGAVGKRLVPLLLSRGHDVTATTRTPEKAAALRAAGAEPVVVDGLDGAAMTRAVLGARPEAVVHQMTALGNLGNLRNLDRELALTNRLRTDGTEILLRAARAAGATRLVAQSYTGWPNERSGGRVKRVHDDRDPRLVQRQGAAGPRLASRLSQLARGIPGRALRRQRSRLPRLVPTSLAFDFGHGSHEPGTVVVTRYYRYVQPSLGVGLSSEARARVAARHRTVSSRQKDSLRHAPLRSVALSSGARWSARRRSRGWRPAVPSPRAPIGYGRSSAVTRVAGVSVTCRVLSPRTVTKCGRSAPIANRLGARQERVCPTATLTLGRSAAVQEIKMNRRLLVASMLAALSVAATASLTPALAQDCQVGQGLGSSLLIPYFEVDTSSGSGVTTLFSVNNESNSPALVRVVMWTDWGIPTLGFDVYLAERDLQSFNIRDLLSGLLPSTGGGADLTGFPFCTGPLNPIYTNPALSPGQLATLSAYHRGQPNPTVGGTQGLCAGENQGDAIARGYVTVDVVDECSGIRLDKVFTPADSEYPYFADGGGSTGIAIVSNRLWGDYFIVNPGQDFAQGGEAVPLWADAGVFNSADELTFYGRFESYTATDDRVPLPDLWSTRFLQGGPFSGGTELIVWRDVGTAESDPINCATRPSWWPLQESFLTARDEAGEAPVFLSSTNVYDLATQKAGIADLVLPYNFGRLQLGLADGPGLTNPRQAWVVTVMSADGRYSLAMDATAINERCGAAP